MLSMRPAATALRTKRTQRVAGRSAVKRPCPATSAGSSSRRMARPTHVVPAPFAIWRLACAVMAGFSLRSMFQRPAHHRAHQVATVFAGGLMILKRIDRACRGVRGGAEHGIARRLAVKRSFCFGNAPRTWLGAAKADARFGNLAAFQP